VGAIPERLQSLLAFLILNRHTAQSRESLAFLFWADSNDAQARTNLRRAIHNLRRILPDVEQFVTIDAKALQWRADAPFKLDVAEFEQAIATAEQAEQSIATTRAALERAIDLYRGKLLPSCYDEWIEPEQERLHQACIRVYTALLQILQEQQDYNTAIRYAQQLLRLDPLNEAAYAHLMQFYALSGDRANALQAYHRCMTVLRDELGVDPSLTTRNLYDRLLNETDPQLTPQIGIRQERGGDGEMGSKGDGEMGSGAVITPSLHPPIVPSLSPHIDWGEAVDVSLFYGRVEELNTLKQWITHSRCRMIALLGMGGIGKTSLSVKLAQELVGQQDESNEMKDDRSHSSPIPHPSPFQYLIWRSLRNAPPLEILLAELVPFLSNQQDAEPTLNRLNHWLRQSRCLIILDNMETILQGEQHSGRYRSGYEDYSGFLQMVGETAHQSCLILTSREKPAEVSALEGMDLPVRSLLLSGSSEAAMALIQSKGLFGSEQQQRQLCQFYGNNPLALKIVATSIQELFDGDISAFLSHDAIIFNGIHRLLEQQCQRCTPVETIVMYWLAINRDWTTIHELAEDIVPKISRAELLEALESLRWRSLIEKQSGSYSQQPVVMEYVTEKLVEQISTELKHQSNPLEQHAPTSSKKEVSPFSFSFPPSPSLLQTHALLKACSNDFIRDIQIREILQPILRNLLNHFGSRDNLAQHLSQVVHELQSNAPLQPGYAGGNILNLLGQFCKTLTNFDFSQLTLWQADLRDVHLHQCNLAEADLSKTVFTETLSLPLAVAFSSDGKLLATGDANREVQVWQVADGKNLLIGTGHTEWVWSVAFSPDNRILASGSSDHTVKLWDLQTGQCCQTLREHTCQVWSIAFHPQGHLLASASEDQTIKLWDLPTGRCVQTLQGHTGWVRSVAFSSDGQFLVSGSDDETVRVWQVETGICQKILQGHAGRIWSVACSPDGEILASSSSDRTIKLWHRHRGTCIHTLEGHTNWVRSIAFSQDGQLLVSGSEDRTIKLWSVPTGECRQTLRGHRNWVRSVAFSPDGQMIASGSGDHTVKLWQVLHGQCRKTLQGYVNRVWSVAFAPTHHASNPSIPSQSTECQGILASANDDHTIKIWDLNTLTCQQILSEHTNSVCAIAFNTTGNLLASGSEDQTVKLWDIQTGRCLYTLEGHTSRIWSVAFNTTGNLLASGSEDQTVKLWDTNGNCLNTLRGHNNWVCSVAFSPGDRPLLASGSYDQTIKLWNPLTEDCLQTLTGHNNWVWSVAFSPNGQMLASGSGDHTIKLWDTQTGKCLKTLEGHQSRVWSVAFSPDGQVLASVSSDQTVKLWDIQTGECLKTLAGHTNLAWSVAFSPDGLTLASGSQDESVRLWNWQTGECLAILRSARPYEGTNIFGAVGITEAQRTALKQLGAVDQPASISVLSQASQTSTQSSSDTVNAIELPSLPEPGQLSLLPLVGRQPEWQTIQKWIKNPGKPVAANLLLLTGESGIGKTRLLEELSETVQANGGQVLWGRGFESEMVRPYSAWVDALRSHLSDIPELPTGLAPLFPELHPTNGEQHIDRNRLFDAVAQCLSQLVHRAAPVVVLVDDIQWLDEASAALLHYVIRLSHSSIQFACTARPQELKENVAVSQFIQALKRDRRIQTIQLQPLNQQSITELAHCIDADLDGNQVYSDSGGNPLYALEIAQAIVDSNRPYSDTLESLIHDRLQQLDESTQELLTWAAALGRSFSLTQLAHITNSPLPTLLSATEQLERRNILRPTTIVNDEVGYLFAHDVVRQVAYHQLSEPRRHLIHRHIAHQLQLLAETDDTLASDVAYHAMLGGNHELAVSSLQLAAERCLRLFAYADAADLVQRGIKLCQSLEPRSRISLHLRLLKVGVLAGITKEQAIAIEANLNQLLQEAKRLGLKEEVAIGMEAMIALNYDHDNLTSVHQHCLQAAEQGRSASPAITARMLAYTGWCLADIGREMQRAEALLLEAQSLAERVGLELNDIPCGLGCVRRHTGDYDDARPLLKQAWQMASAEQDHWREFACLSYLVMLELEAGHFADALENCQELQAVASQLGEGNESAVAAAFDALARLRSQQPNAEAALAQSITTLRNLDAQRTLAYVLTTAAEQYLEHNQTDTAIAHAQAALTAARIVNHPSDVALAWATLIRGYFAQGNDQKAIEQFCELNQQLDDRTLSGRARQAIAHLKSGDF
jgi:WD40 repeat protein/DNA-binding SARP family transcriptional activator/predicted ATPase/DNA polymerase III delta prime subunit